jgi:hypothetical protein
MSSLEATLPQLEPTMKPLGRAGALEGSPRLRKILWRRKIYLEQPVPSTAWSAF